MGELLYEKILKRMMGREKFNSSDFIKELRFVRFDKIDSMAIMKDMEKKGIIKLNPVGNGLGKFLIVITNKRKRHA